MRLEATYAEVRHVLQIRREEFDWLENCEHVGYMRRPIRGNLDTVYEEIGSHEVGWMCVHAHIQPSLALRNIIVRIFAQGRS